MTRTLGTDLRGHRTRQNESANAGQEGVQKTHLREVEMTEAVQGVKRTPWERQGALRTSGSGRGSCGTPPNASENAQNKKVKKTHQRELKASQCWIYGVPGMSHMVHSCIYVYVSVCTCIMCTIYILDKGSVGSFPPIITLFRPIVICARVSVNVYPIL